MSKWLFLIVVWMLAMTITVEASSESLIACEEGTATPAGPADHQVKDGEIWPWPWGSECPFNWSDIEGTWGLQNTKMQDTFEVKVLSESESGSRYFSVSQHDGSGKVVAEGSGYVQKGERIIRAALYDLPREGQLRSDPSSGYWVIVRFYRDQKARNCQDAQVTALTMRPFNACEASDHHYLIEKTEKIKKEGL